jgi:NAD(P)H-hydrate epimerase
VGAGLVTLATARSILVTSPRGPEVTLLPLHEASAGTIDAEAADTLLKNLDGYAALLVGPGLGREKPTGLFLRRLLGMEQPRRLSRVGFRVQELAENAPGTATHPPEDSVALPPTVLDADALNLLSEVDDWAANLHAEQFVLTPHPGEMRRLLGVDELASDVVQVATDAAQKWQQVVVLKGDTTVIAAPDGRSAVLADGNPALATAGTGDVLAGAIAGLLAQGMPRYDAAVLGVYLHSAAGALLRDELGEAGTLASDLLIRLPRAIKELR